MLLGGVELWLSALIQRWQSASYRAITVMQPFFDDIDSRYKCWNDDGKQIPDIKNKCLNCENQIKQNVLPTSNYGFQAQGFWTASIKVDAFSPKNWTLTFRNGRGQSQISTQNFTKGFLHFISCTVCEKFEGRLLCFALSAERMPENIALHAEFRKIKSKFSAYSAINGKPACSSIRSKIGCRVQHCCNERNSDSYAISCSEVSNDFSQYCDKFTVTFISDHKLIAFIPHNSIDRSAFIICGDGLGLRSV